MTDEERIAFEQHMPDDLAAALREHSPRLYIRSPILIRYDASPTGWICVIPEDAP